MDYWVMIMGWIEKWLMAITQAWSHAHWVDKGFVVYFTTLAILWLFSGNESHDKPSAPPKNSPLPFQKQQLLISKAGYVRKVIGWCTQHLGTPARGPRIPELTISYYPHQKKHGNYVFSGKRIRIYVNNHTTISQLTDTIIHEYVHFLEIRSQVHQKEYDKHLQEIGYYKNPYEVSAREKAAHHVKDCLADMRRMGYIS